MESKKHTILIVDDVTTNLDILKSLLAKKYNIKVAKNGKLAVQIAQKSPNLDLILLDVMMPEMDGFQACEILKNDERTKDIPVIFLTAKSETEAIVKGFEMGGVDYLTKPFNPAELLARVSTHLLIKDQTEMIVQQNREQKEMLHILSHDLGNHFTIISMGLELFNMGNENAVDYLDKVKDATAQGIDIINLVREMRSLEEKDINLSMIDIKQIVQESVSLLIDRFEDKNIQIAIDIQDGLTVVAEKRSLVNSVINNILTNAHKFSLPGSTIDISAWSDKNQVILSIEDRGIGIPPNIMKHLFDINENISRTGTNGETGTGFGMSLMKSFVEHYNGSLEVHSKDIDNYPDDHGTSVIIRFQTQMPDQDCQ